MTHEIMVLCECADDPCRMEVYVSDVRIARNELAWVAFERDTLAGYVEELMGMGMSVEDYQGKDAA